MSEDVLITGGTGFIGSHLANKINTDDRRITVLARERGNGLNLPENIHTTIGDVTSKESLPAFEQFDSVLHLAGVVSVSGSIEEPQQTFSVNAAGTQNVLEKCREYNVNRLLYLSSASIYGDPEELPISEEHPVRPTHPYAATKAAGENLVQGYGAAYDIETTIVRAFTVYGPGQAEGNLIPSAIQQAKNNNQIRLGNIEPTRDFVHVTDLVSAIEILIAQDETEYEIYNVGSGQENSVEEVVRTILQELNMDGKKVISTKGGRDQEVEISRMVSDNTRIRSTGWRPKYNLREGIITTVQKTTM